MEDFDESKFQIDLLIINAQLKKEQDERDRIYKYAVENNDNDLISALVDQNNMMFNNYKRHVAERDGLLNG